MKSLSSAQVRQMFLDFFKSKGHSVEPSASLIPVDDPTLLWINSGVATLKKYFDGSVVPENHRITNAQKSIRTNDIENVGKTARHHTMFEMLGNFSIGDYFKPEAITWAWEFLTSPEWMAFDPEKLYVTVYPKDEEAKRLWLETGVAEDHIVPIEDNFWDIGAGPCGPDSEIFYDRGQEYNDVAEDDPENYPGGENERYLEIWNLVFSEFNHTADHTYEPLPHKNIDTGMGLERMVSIIQDAPTNFETDLFMPIIKATEKMSAGHVYGEDEEKRISFKVIADHIRAVSFAIGDGALPSNEGRGYVLRRLIRRAVMHGKKLGINKPFLYELVPVVGHIMESYYPEILEKQDFIQKVIRNEEERFHETINDGLTMLEQQLDQLRQRDERVLDGKLIFQLYDTYGFPVELTEEVAEDAGFDVDHKGFEAEMEAQRNRARAARSQEQSMNVQVEALTDYTKESIFTGYVSTECDGTLDFLLNGEEEVQSANAGDTVRAIFSESPFYAEMGGQIGDTGEVRLEDGSLVAKVIDTQKAPNGQALHTLEVVESMTVGNRYHLAIDATRRRFIANNHTATHLLHHALKEVLGEHASQAGSLVTENYLRFDFTHFGQVTPQELKAMEQKVNEVIWQALPVTTVETDIESAKAMGAEALFGEKYGKEVRVVNVGDWSIELCGGTHVKNSQDLGLFKIMSESGIGAGVRRIEAVTSKAAYEAFRNEQEALQAVALEVKAPVAVEAPQKVEQLQQQLKEAQKEVQQLHEKLAASQAGDIFNNVKEVAGVSYIAEQAKVSDMNQLRQLADQWKQQHVSDILVLGLVNDGKVNLLVAMTDDMVSDGLRAGDLIKEIAPKVGGGGGGRPQLAQAGGKNPAGLNDALASVATWIESQRG